MNVEEVRETFGDYLIKERESRNITAEELAKATHLSIHFIEALEHNDFALISQRESIPGFLKLYARHLPLNYELALKRYQIEDERILKQRIHKELSFSHDYAPPVARITDTWFAGRLGRWIIPAACAAAAVVISLSIYLSPEKTQLPAVPSSAKFSSTAQDIQPLQATAIQPVLSNPETSSVSASLPEETVPPKPSESLQSSAPIPSPEAIQENGKTVVIGNRDSKRYHLPGMKYYNEVKAYHRVQFASEEEALKAGYFKAKE